MEPSLIEAGHTTFIPDWLPTFIEILSNIGGIAFLGYIGVMGIRWIKNNNLSSVEAEIVKEMLINNHRVLFLPERSDYPLHIKFMWNTIPYPSENRLEMARYYEAFQRLLEKGFIGHGVDEIYVLTSKGIKAANKRIHR